MQQQITRPFFRDLYSKHLFDPIKLARKAGTEPRTVLAMMRAHPVSRDQAERVLQALAGQTGQAYSLATVRVATTDG